ncbi:MAG: hypothetical protein AB7F86_10400 [Bdellovibrionales bacterium]
MLTCFFKLVLSSIVMAAESPEPPRGLDFRLDASASYFSSQTNYAAGGGGTEDLPNGGYFTEYVGIFKYIQDLNDNHRLYGGMAFSFTESEDGTTTRSNSGVRELLFGGQYWGWASGKYFVIPQLDVVYPLFRVSRSSDDALLGEGALKVKAGSWLTWTAGDLWPFVFLGYEYRDEGRSHAIPYSIGAKYKLSPLWFQLEYRGYERLFDNADTENRASRDAFLRKVDGGSYRYYSLNPSMSEVAAQVGFSFGAIGVSGGVAYTVNGDSEALGWTFEGGLTYTPRGSIKGASRERRIPRQVPIRAEPATPEQKFDAETQFKEEQFFQEEKPPEPTGPERVEPERTEPTKNLEEVNIESPAGAQPDVQLRPKKKSVQRKARPKPKPKKKKKGLDLDRMMKETEDSLKGQ